MKYILACCHCYWYRFFVIRVPNRYYIVERCCYVCIFMLPIVHGLQTPSEHFAIWGGCFSFCIQSFRIKVCAGACWTCLLPPQLPVVQSFEFLNSSLFFVKFWFLTQIVEQLNRKSAAFSVYMINCSYFVFVADGFLNHMVSQFRMEQKRMHVEPDLCGNPTRKQIVPVSILITVNSRLGHGSAFWSLWTHSELIKRSM